MSNSSLFPFLDAWADMAGMWYNHAERQQYAMMRSPAMADAMEMKGRLRAQRGDAPDILSQPEYNHKFLTKTRDGNIVEISPETIAGYFAEGQPEGQGWPRIIMVPNHARGSSLNDLHELMDGAAAMRRDAAGRPLNIAYAGEPVTPDKTIIVFVCEAEKYYELNGANTLRRMHEQQDVHAHGGPDPFIHINRGAARMAHMLLKTMLTEPSQMDMTDGRRLSDRFADAPAEPLCLRPDAARIAQHFSFDGFSMGSTTVRDAGCYLADELRAKDVQGRDLVQANVEHEYRPITEGGDHDIRNIVRNIGILSMGGLIEPIPEEYRKLGVRAVAFNNQHDTITKHKKIPSRRGDEHYIIQGDHVNYGHSPASTLGTLDAVDAHGSTMQGNQGYAVKDPRVARRLKEFSAPHYGKAAIANLRFHREAEGADENYLTIDTAAGTTDELFECYQPDIVKALTRAGIRGARVEGSHANARSYEITAADDFFSDPAAVRKLQKAFEYMRKETPGLMISDAVLEEDIPRMLDTLGQGPIAAKTAQSAGVGPSAGR